MKSEKKMGQNGALTVEFAILLPVLFLFIFGILEFGILLFNQHVITNAAREGAREGIEVGLDRFDDGSFTCDQADCGGNASCSEHVSKSETIAEQYVIDHVVTFGDSANPLCVWATSSDTLSGSDLTVTVSYNYDFLVLSTFGFGPMDLKSESIMKLE